MLQRHSLSDFLTTEQVLERLAEQPPLQRFEIMRVLRAVRIDDKLRFLRSELDASIAQHPAEDEPNRIGF